MPVALTTDTLRTLHRMLRQLEDLRGQLAAGPRRVAAIEAAVRGAEASRDAAQGELKQARVATDQKQLQLKSAESRIRDLEGKLNTCKTNREYQALGDQIAADRMAARVLEDEILESLEKVDSLKPAVPAAESAIAAARKELADASARVAAEAGRLEEEVARVRGELDATERELADDVRPKYERVVKHKGADGLAAVQGQTCGGCHQQITVAMFSELLAGRIALCRGCGRLLYTPSETPAPA